MNRRNSKRRNAAEIKYIESSEDESSENDESDVEIENNKKIKTGGKPKVLDGGNSSSESDLDDYCKFKTNDKLDSSFYKIKNHETASANIISPNTSAANNDSYISKETPSTSKDENVSAYSHNADTSNIFKHFIDYQQQQEKLIEMKDKFETLDKSIQIASEHLDIKSLLAAGELNNTELLNNDSGTESDSDDSLTSDLEDVAPIKTPIPKETLQITVDLPNSVKMKPKIEDTIEMKLMREMNRIKKETQVYVHKVHLLCWIAHGNYVNSVLNNEKLMGLALSLIPSQHCYPDGRIDLTYIEQITKWFGKIFHLKTVKKTVDEIINELPIPLLNSLQLQINKKETETRVHFVYVFVCILRSLGIQARLVLSFRTVPLRPPQSQLHSLSYSKKDNNSKTDKKIDTKTSGKTETKKSAKQLDDSKSNYESPKTEVRSRSTSTQNKKSKLVLKKLPAKKTEKEKETVEKPKTKSSSSPADILNNLKNNSQLRKKIKAVLIPQLDGANGLTKVRKKIRSRTTQKQSSTTNSPLNRSKQSEEKNNHRTKVTNTKTTNKAKSKTISEQISKNNKNNSRVTPKKRVEQDESEMEFDMKSKRKIKRKIESSQIDRRVLSSDSDKSVQKSSKHKIGDDVWVEVYLEDEEKWISIDVIKAQVHCVQELYSRASSPVSYIVAWNNNGTLKDVTSRYCKSWHTVTRKLRVDPVWWTRTLKPYRGRETARDKEENDELNRMQLEQPLPKTISEYKNHPLYALKRHLLKFEAIYPQDALILGFIRNEPVYARECVHTLHSREIWVKHARVVKPGETPYKIVKARPKYDKLTGTCKTDIPLEIFGQWQTQDYEPPVAENGVVPRNAYGNVELFKKCMLPIGTVHLQLPGLNRVAKKLQIDCANAVVGFDFHSGSSHPTFDGFIVCKEFEQTLIEAWEQEQDEIVKRAQEKIEKRVYDNWRRIIKGLFIRERLKRRYGDFSNDDNKEDGKTKKSSTVGVVSKKRRL